MNKDKIIRRDKHFSVHKTLFHSSQQSTPKWRVWLAIWRRPARLLLDFSPFTLALPLFFRQKSKSSKPTLRGIRTTAGICKVDKPKSRQTIEIPQKPQEQIWLGY